MGFFDDDDSGGYEYEYDPGSDGTYDYEYDSGGGDGGYDYEADSWWSDDYSDSDSDSDWVDSALDMASNIWDWTNTSAGVSAIGGALAGGLSIWGEQRAQDDRMEYADQMTEASRARTERVNKHNESINAPTELNMRKWTGKK